MRGADCAGYKHVSQLTISIVRYIHLNAVVPISRLLLTPTDSFLLGHFKIFGYVFGIHSSQLTYAFVKFKASISERDQHAAQLREA